MLSDTYGRALRKFLPPFAVFALVTALHLSTFTPSLWNADALNYVSNGVAWSRGENSLPVRSATYVGWEASIGLLPAARSTPLDVLRLILGAKALGIFYAIAAAVGTYLVAKRLFGSIAFAFMTAALFAANPYVWLWGQAAMTDLPGAAYVIFSFLCFVRFWQDRRYADLAAASALAGVATVFRTQSLIILVPYAVGILSIAFETPGQPFAARLKTAVKLGAITCAFPAALFLAVFGMPWEFTPDGAFSFPRLRELLPVIKWYVARDIGWIWCLLAWSGLALGLYRRKTRTVALMLVAFIAVGASYFAGMYPGDTPRYLIPTIPFTLLGIGFVWSVCRRQARAAISLFTAVYVFSAYMGFRSPAPPGTKDPSSLAKAFILQNFLASDAASKYVGALPVMMSDIAFGEVVPADAVVIMPEQGTLIERYINMRVKSRRPEIVKIKRHLPLAEQVSGLPSLPEGRPIVLVAGLEDTPIEALLLENGFRPKGDIGGAVIFMKPIAAP